MIDLIDIDSDHVLGVRVHQNLLPTDIDLTMNLIEKKIRTRGMIALYAEVDSVTDVDFGVLQKEFTYGPAQLKSLGHITRAALVTDIGAIRDNEMLMSLVPSVEVKTFSPAEKAQARAWVRQPLPASSRG